ncbi:MAG: FHA domain-containing protein [Myxococcales bacterium]|nr:FHA domain-containing protein [Myxococcales bacterium]
MTTRYRLRFLLQEFDLPKGETLIGRSAECHVTIEDPLVSRQHARIMLEGDAVTFEDLGSRNGVRINGLPVKRPVQLRDGDRIRIGTQELVFCRVGQSAISNKTTGFLRYCAHCRLPYPQELAACPACGATEQTDEEETLSGQFGASSKHAWNVQLLLEVTERAVSLGRSEDALSMFERARAQVEERLSRGGAVFPTEISDLVVTASHVSELAGDPALLAWGLKLHVRVPSPISEAETHAIARALTRHRAALEGPVQEVVRSLSSLSSELQGEVAQLRALLEEARQ